VPVHSADVDVRARFSVADKYDLGGPPGAFQDVTFDLRVESSAPAASVVRLIAHAERACHAAQTFRAAATTDVWETVASGQESTLQQRARCRLAASFAVDSARQAMDLMYRAGGTTSSKRTHQLARCWRDLHVVGQAASVAPDWYPLTGRVFLGLDPGPRLL
jgi:alkylation response protein AidB-like acyl-CoA dehydrogenase